MLSIRLYQRIKDNIIINCQHTFIRKSHVANGEDFFPWCNTKLN